MSSNINWRNLRKAAARDTNWPNVADQVFAELGIPRSDLEAFEKLIHGQCVLPGMPTYDKDRQGQGISAYVSSPLLLIYCDTMADVWEAMKICYDRDWKFTLRSGGHSTAGYSVNNHVVIDLSGLDSITVDRANLVAQVGVGATFDLLNSTLKLYGAHVPTGGCGDVGVGGFVQGGGFGFTSRMYGMMSDCVASALVMLWDGRVVEASASKNSDLFWAIRGGTGGNFGVLLQVTLRLVDLPEMWGFVLTWDAADAPAALHESQKSYMKDSAYGSIGYMSAMTTDKDGKPIYLFAGICTEGRDVGLQAIAALRAVGSPQLIFDQTDSYPNLDPVLLNALPGVPTPMNKTFEIKDCGYVDRMIELADWQRLFKYFADNVQKTNRYSIVFIEPYGGAINAVGAKDSAFVHRDTYMDIYLDSFWQEGTDFTDYDQAKAWLDGFMDLLTPLMNGHKYQNYPRPGTADYRYNFWGEYYNSLLWVKQKFDPNGRFMFEQAITPFPDDPRVRRTSVPSMFSDPAITYEPWSKSFVNGES